MAVKYNTSVITDGLVFSLDAANKKSYFFGENLLTRSQEFNTGWSLQNTTISPNTAIAPDGTLTADLVTNTPNQLSYVGQNTFISANTTYTISVYVKPVTTNKIIAIELDTTGSGTYIVPVYNLDNLTTSGGGTKSIVNVGNGWYRIICTFTTSAGTPKFNVFYIGAYGSTPDTVSMYLWGAQLEKSYTANTYVATTSSISSGSITWLDLSGNGSNGTLTSGPIYSNTNAGVMTFDGTNDFIDVANNSFTRFPHDQAWSFSIFCKPITQNTTFPGFIILGNAGTTGILIYYTAVGIYWKHNATDSFITTRDLNVIKNITLTYAGSGNVLAYVNGTLVQNLPTMVSTDTTSNFLMGRADQFGNVDIYNFMKYNRQLSASEVLSNFNALRGRYGI